LHERHIGAAPGGVRFEHVYRVGASGPEILFDYPIEPVVPV
jgi:hypothetical protein